MLSFALLLLFTVVLCSEDLSRVPSLVTFDELRSLNATCDDRDTCGRPPNEDMRTVNCQCGPQCVTLGTCCLDAPQEGTTSHSSYGGGQGCEKPYGNGFSIFMVDKCPSDWDGDDLCTADGQQRSDLMLLVPVTSVRTGKTYRNHFCFLCHSVDDSEDSVVSWDISLLWFNRSVARDVDLSSLTFNKTHWTHPGLPPNSILGLKTKPPKQLSEERMVYCRPHVVDSCAANWTEPLTRSKCGSYTALVTVRNDASKPQIYRNVHCALCNWLTTSGVVPCRHPEFETRPESLSGGFAVTDAKGIVDIAGKVYQELFLISEDQEGECREGQIYDKIAKKCRQVLCGRKMKMVNGRCVANSA